MGNGRKSEELNGELLIMNVLKRIVRVMDIAVFVFTTIAIAGVFYEGMTLISIYGFCMEVSLSVGM